MPPQIVSDAAYFVAGLVITTVIIYVATHLMGERGDWGRAIVTALIGYLIYYIFYTIVGGFLGALLGFLVWLWALRSIYRIAWIRSFITADHSCTHIPSGAGASCYPCGLTRESLKGPRMGLHR